MKNKTIAIISTSTTLLAALVLSSCGAQNILDQFESSVDETSSSISTMDDIESEDLSIVLNEESTSIANLDFVVSEVKLVQRNEETQAKIDEAIALRSTLKEKQLKVDENKLQFHNQYVSLKANITSFKDSSIELTNEEKDQFSEYKVEMKSAFNELKGTIGNVYQKIYNLRGHYNVSHIDEIIETYEYVQPYMDIRVDESNKAIFILTNANELISEILANEN